MHSYSLENHASPSLASKVHSESLQSNYSSGDSSSIPIGMAEENQNEANKEVEDNVEIEDEHYQRKRRKKVSTVWDEMTVVKLENGVEHVQCNHCKLKMKKQKDGTTTQYRRHLNGCIKRSLNIKGQQNLCLVPSTRRSESVSVHSWKYDQAKMREVISHMIMVHELPFSFVEYELFNLVMQSATPYYQRISRATTKNDCWTSYELEKKRIKGLLKSVDKVSITTDIWTSGQNIQYMVMTAHFIDSDWKLQKRVLNFVDVPPPHTGTVVCDALYKCLQDWGIEEKIWTITVDNASYNDSAVRMLLDCLSFHKSLPLNSQLFHVRCCAHILNLLVQDGLSEIKEIIEDVRESVKYISASSQRLHNFTEICKQLQLPKKKLILDCCTRWNATYAMLSCALEFKQVFPRYALRDSNYRHLPTDDDWHRVEEVCTVLGHFSEITKLISGSEYPTANLCLPELWSIKEVLDQKSQS